MKPSEAARLVAVLSAYWPGTDIRDETAQLWEADLLAFEITDGMDAALQLGRSGRFMPSLGEFIDAIREVRNDRLRVVHRALPSGTPGYYPFALFLAEHPDMAERVRAMQFDSRGKRTLMSHTFATLLEGEIRA